MAEEAAVVESFSGFPESPSRQDTELPADTVSMEGPISGMPSSSNPLNRDEAPDQAAAVPGDKDEATGPALAQSPGANAQGLATSAAPMRAALPPMNVSEHATVTRLQSTAGIAEDGNGQQAQSQASVAVSRSNESELLARKLPARKPAILAQQALRTSRGRQRVPLESLGPAVFNRQGTVTDSRHCLALMDRILKDEAFATFRYEAGYCHEPNPNDPSMVARHATTMHAKDPALPRPCEGALRGVFAKTHLVTALQMYKAGNMPELSRLVEARSQEDPTEVEEFKLVLEH